MVCWLSCVARSDNFSSTASTVSKVLSHHGLVARPLLCQAQDAAWHVLVIDMPHIVAFMRSARQAFLRTHALSLRKAESSSYPRRHKPKRYSRAPFLHTDAESVHIKRCLSFTRFHEQEPLDLAKVFAHARNVDMISWHSRQGQPSNSSPCETSYWEQ